MPCLFNTHGRTPFSKKKSVGDVDWGLGGGVGGAELVERGERGETVARMSQ